MALTEIHLPGLRRLASGKVRDLFELPGGDGDALLFVASDRLSAYDVVLRNGIPNKGAILTLTSAHWFRVLADCLPDLRTHFLAVGPPPALRLADAAALAPRCMRVRRLRVVPLEAIVRGYLAGSAWAEYRARGTVHGLAMPPGMRLAQRLPAPLYTPSTKAPPGAHDENIHPADAWRQLDGADADPAAARALAARVEALALRIYAAAAEYAEARGIIIADTKFEFGLDADGALYLADEVLTPDSSRFWPRDSHREGEEPDSFDKQFVRNWLVGEGLKGKDGVELPADVCAATEARYRDAFARLTGQDFDEAAAAAAAAAATD